MLKKIFSTIGLIIAAFVGLIGLLLLIIGFVETIPPLWICGIIFTALSILGGIYFVEIVPKTNRNETSVQENVFDKKILDIFSYNRYLLHRIFIPLLKFSIEIGINPINVSRHINEAYYIADIQIHSLSELDNLTNQLEQQLTKKISRILKSHQLNFFTDSVIQTLTNVNLNH